MHQRKLEPGAVIAIVAPSGALPEEYLHGAVDQFRSRGYEVRVMPHVCGPRCSVFAADDEARASDLMAALSDPDVSVVWCARGGYGAVRTLQAMARMFPAEGDDPLAIFAKSDKVIVGFSDITALNSAVVSRGGIALHGPMLKHIANYGLDAPDVAQTLDLLEGKALTHSVVPMPGSRKGTVTAKVVGGNLSLVSSLCQTPVEIDADGCILFIEDLNEYNYHVDRMIQNLRFAGKLSRLAGLVVGQMTGMKDGATPFGRNAYEVVADAVADYDFPVLIGFPAGHETGINHPIMLGATATLTVDDDSASLAFPCR